MTERAEPQEPNVNAPAPAEGTAPIDSAMIVASSPSEPRRPAAARTDDEVSSGVLTLDAEARAELGEAVRFGAYELIAEIAAGGMGHVYLCRRAGEAGFQRLFALKVMHEHLARDRAFVDMLLDEGRLAARLHHHNVVSVVDLGENERGYFLVMDYVEGCSFAELLARHRRVRPPELIVPILIGALSGLHAAHTLEDDDGKPLELVHRDVSPQNILIGVDGDAKIADFGVARARARMTHTGPGVLKGKLAYTAPELLEGLPTADRRADIFAAGAALWSALTGVTLFSGETQAEVVRKILKADIPPPSTVGLRPPACFDAPCLRALERDPAKRFQTAAEMADCLRTTAMGAGLLGAPIQVARWVRETFVEELAGRRRVIRAAMSGARPKSREELPGLPEVVVDETSGLPVGQLVDPVGAPTPPAAPVPDAGPPLVEPAVVALLMFLAFVAGSIVMIILHAR